MYVNRNWSIKIRELIYTYKQLPTQKKATLLGILLSGLILITGTISIIMTTVFQVEDEQERVTIEKFDEALREISEEINTNISDSGYDKLSSDINTLDKNFKSYEEEILLFDSYLTEFDLPLSSPINEN